MWWKITIVGARKAMPSCPTVDADAKQAAFYLAKLHAERNILALRSRLPPEGGGDPPEILKEAAGWRSGLASVAVESRDNAIPNGLSLERSETDISEALDALPPGFRISF
ncbi:MAG: hypothetical protein R3F11_02720 [Verrucomicrobiales bacterium]